MVLALLPSAVSHALVGADAFGRLQGRRHIFLVEESSVDVFEIFDFETRNFLADEALDVDDVIRSTLYFRNVVKD